MAVLAPSDWQIHNMDLNGRQQRSSPANDSNAPSAPSSNGHHHQPSNSHQQQQPPPQSYPYPVQQQPQGSWTPSITAQPFYPSFYPNQQPQPYPQLPQQTPYFDPANAQLAQWAYQQMMFAQQGFLPPQQPQRPSPSGRTPQNASPNEYFAAQNQMNMYNPFPSGTPPPPHPHRTPSVDQQQPPNAGPFAGYHPYRRPTRQQTGQSQSHSPSPPQSDNNDWRPGGVVSPPYARPDASGSSSSVNSAGSGRPRTDSNQSARSNRGHDTPPNSSVRSRNGSGASAPPPTSGGSSNRSSPSGSTSSAPRIPHHRNLSSSSNSSSGSRPSGLSPSPPTTSTSTSSANTSSSTIPRPARPSPLSQGTFTASEKRMSRDDSDLQAMLESTSVGAAGGRSGLKGRLRRALTFNAAQAALKEEEDDDASIKASNLGSSSKLKAKTPALINSATSKSSANGSSGIRSSESMADDAESTATIQTTTTTKKRGRAASLFNSRLNASTDNISLSSTVSSASVMIRKLGSMGKLARRNSLAGITSLFKDKKNKEKEDEESGEGSVSGKKKKDKKGAKAEASEASVSHVTAELDRSSDWGGPEMSGLSPAAKLARQHTLKTNAEAAAKAKAQQEAAAAATAAAAGASKTFPNGNSAGVPTWEKNTTTRQGSVSPVKGGGAVRVNEDGTRVVVEDEDEDDRSDDDHYTGPPQGDSIHAGWDDDEDWDGEDDEDVTIRLGVEKVNMEDEVVYEEPEPWAVDVRRSVERTRQPTKGILKNADKYDQAVYLAENAGTNRVRSNSYNSHPTQAEAGPLARIPSPDPDHIDGLHRHGSHSSGHHGSPTAPSLPSFSFESSPTTRSSFDAPRDSSDTTSTVSHHMFTHPNSSAPVLSTMSASAPTLTHRSATTPSNSKRLAFANNLSVYDTFSANVYDRRSEPATWSRLTPALAQRIKEELNSYKMEEMEVHASSRIHTQFFV